MRGSASLALRKRNRGVPKAVGNSRVDAAKLEERQRAEQLRAKRLKKKEKMDRLTTGNYLYGKCPNAWAREDREKLDWKCNASLR